VNTLLYPFTLGMMAAVNPCGFPLLPAYLELFVGGPAAAAAPRASRALKAVTAAAYATVGFVILFGTLGLVTQLGWSALADHSASAARYVMVAVGAGMVVVGVITLARRDFKLPLPVIGSGAGLRRPAAVAVFGFSYGVASIGCALPLFIGGVAASFGYQSTLRGIGDLLAYALGMGTVLGALAVGIALVGRGAGRHLRRASRWVPVAGGLILVAVGAYLTWYWVTDIASPGSSFALQRLVERVQLDISNPINAHAQLIGGLLGAAVVAAVIAGGLSRPAPVQPRAAPEQKPAPVPEPEPSRT
jgi:cytochrome c-type biogenesis protein